MLLIQAKRNISQIFAFELKSTHHLLQVLLHKKRCKEENKCSSNTVLATITQSVSCVA